MRARIVALIAVAAFAACSGGTSSVPSSRLDAGESTLGNAVRAQPALTGALSFSIALTPKFAAAKSATVTVSAAGGSPSAPTLLACTASACTATLAPPSGIDTFAVTLYGGAGATGATLAAGSLTRAITAATKALGVTFGAPVASLSLALSKSSVTVGVPVQVELLFAALDARGNAILGPYATSGGSSLTVTLADSDTSGATKLSVAQLSASPAVAPAITYSGASVPGPAIVASAPGLKSATATLTVAVTAAQIIAALKSVASYYQTLSHVSTEEDLTLTAKHMTESGEFATATVTPGGIDATMPNGGRDLVVADRTKPEVAVQPVVQDPPISAPNGHEIAFLNNEDRNDGAFHPQRQHDFASAFLARGFTPQAGYGVDVLDITLENIIRLGSEPHALDYLNVSTHGVVDAAGTYYWVSTTPITDAALAAYAHDSATGDVVPSLVLENGVAALDEFAFTSRFLAAHLTFNAGSVLDNQSCDGQNPKIVAGPAEIAHLGRYLGWTEKVDGNNSDETDAFLLDRLLGEQSPSVTGLDKYANQRTPPQRPFPLDAIDSAMKSEIRDSPIHASPGYPYAVSRDPDGTIAYLSDETVGTGSGALFDGLPTIQNVYVDEFASPAPLLHILGAFPDAPATVQIKNAFGTATSHPTTQTATEVDATIPASGLVAGSWGDVTVTSGNLASNSVPLTQWTGTLNYSGQGTIDTWDRVYGKGTWSARAAFGIAVRSDVHPTVVTIDTAPVPQNLAFNGLEAGTSGAFSEAAAAFNGKDGAPCGDEKPCGGLTAKLSPKAPGMKSGPFAALGSTFELVPLASPTATCNNGKPGPQGGAWSVFCGHLGASDDDALACVSTPPDFDTKFNYCYLGATGTGAILIEASTGTSYTFVVDPGTYALSVPATAEPAVFEHWGTGAVNVSATFDPPQAAPSPAPTPAGGLRPGNTLPSRGLR